jgi:hypothetical protein
VQPLALINADENTVFDPVLRLYGLAKVATQSAAKPAE